MSEDATSVEAILDDEERLATLSQEQLDALMVQEHGFNDKSDPAPPSAAEAEAPKQEQTPATPKEPAKEGEAEPAEPEKPKGVLTKDGNNYIPYAVLESLRERAGALEAQVGELTQRLEHAQTPQAGQAASEGLQQVIDNLEAIGTELDPQEFASLHEAVSGAKTKLEQFAAWEAQVRQDEQAQSADRIRTAVQADIDAIPKLALLQATRPRAWEAAVAIDRDLLADAAWKDKPRAERFTEVLRLYEQEFGEFALDQDQHSSTPQAPAQPANAAPVPDPQQLARERVRSATTAAPATLSDIPGGQPMAGDEMQQLDQASTVDIQAQMARMSPEQLEAYLARIG